ncbi:MAG TPA: diguanylate cyclase, partial [Solirubrobacteraceae bacterium]|nr:diguanylate cyclase [Solirubrobacteraceae bacterium]
EDVLYNGLMFGAALAVLARGVLVRAQRAAWLAMGGGLLAWSLGELYFTLFLEGSSEIGGVTVADGLYLAMYPCMFLALLLLVVGGVRRLRASMVLDGLIAGLAATTVGAAALLGPVLEEVSASASVGGAAITLAYPIGDLLLAFFTIGALAMTGWRPGRVWMLIAASMLISAIADGTYLYQSATGAYAEGTWLESLWPAAAVLLAVAAWTPWRREVGRQRYDDSRLVIVPAVSLLAALGVLVYGSLGPRLTGPALGLATATVLAVCVRLIVTVRENLTVLKGSRRLALTDSLTGLANRRRLMGDLEAACWRASAERPWTLVMYDLNGFKRYNDTFGHPAGDALLGRLSDKLAAAVGDRGTAYRMGGDEFCVLFRCTPAEGRASLADSLSALSEGGSGFSVSAAHGEVLIPTEGRRPAAILALADQRLYRRKDPTRDGSAAAQLRDVLLQAFQERRPELREHQRGVGALVLAVGRRMGLEGEDLDALARAGELHDVGKIAIPDAILDKPAALNEEEWRFMRRHTILGERILMAASALRPVARLVRSSHERFDGAGYPDGLAGEEIPLGARIIFVCDAYHAMISKRPHSPALSVSEAIGELRACAGSQFDPRVVEAFLSTLAAQELRTAAQKYVAGGEASRA